MTLNWTIYIYFMSRFEASKKKTHPLGFFPRTPCRGLGLGSERKTFYDEYSNFLVTQLEIRGTPYIFTALGRSSGSSAWPPEIEKFFFGRKWQSGYCVFDKKRSLRFFAAIITAKFWPKTWTLVTKIRFLHRHFFPKKWPWEFLVTIISA